MSITMSSLTTIIQENKLIDLSFWEFCFSLTVYIGQSDCLFGWFSRLLLHLSFFNFLHSTGWGLGYSKWMISNLSVNRRLAAEIMAWWFYTRPWRLLSTEDKFFGAVISSSQFNARCILETQAMLWYEMFLKWWNVNM